MEGISGLELIGTTLAEVQIPSIWAIWLLPVCFVVMGSIFIYISVLKRELNRQDRITNIAVSIIIVIFGFIIAIVFNGYKNQMEEELIKNKTKNIYEYRIIDTEYNIDLARYIVVDSLGKTIFLKDSL